MEKTNNREHTAIQPVAASMGQEKLGTSRNCQQEKVVLNYTSARKETSTKQQTTISPMPELSLGVSTAGRRQHKTNENDTIEQTTRRVLRSVVNESVFFDQVEPYALPTFESAEVELKDFLGKGEFGIVMGVKALHVADDCPCQSCRDKQQRQSADAIPSSIDEQRRGAQQQQEVVPHPERKFEIVVDTAFGEGGDGDPISNSSIDPLLPMIPADRHHRRNFTSGVSFAEDVKLSDDIESADESTLSTEDEESVSNLQDDDADTDGEVNFLRGYMSTHVTRHGMGRYAIKRVRSDLKGETQLEAAVDLAVEAKFLTTVRHPNIVKMRGTVGKPGILDFMIVMDRLTMTLRQKMDQWNDETKGNWGLLSRILPQKGKQALQQDQYADKLLAMYDIARAMRYLHNHMILFRDLKPENVALDVRGDMRLFDFGLVKELKAQDLVEAPDSFACTGLTGSRRYMSPEVILCKNYGLKADVYSYSILFWEVFSGHEAYAKMNFDKHFNHVVMKEKRPSKKIAATSKGGGQLLSKALLHSLEEMWNPNPQERPSFVSICDRLSSEYNMLLTTGHPGGGGEGNPRRDIDRSHGSHLSDRTRYLMNRSIRSRCAGGDSSDSVPSRAGIGNSGHGSLILPPHTTTAT